MDKAAATTIVYITGSSNIGFVITIDGVEYTPREAKLLMESEPWKYLLSYENNGYFYYIGGQLGGGDNTLRYWLPNYGTSSGTYFELSERYNTITFNLGHPEKSDWETNDSESASFIRHRPFYSEPKEKSYENDALDMSETNVITLDSDELQLIKTNMYVVVWDGTRYSCMCEEMYGVLYIGNLNLYSAPFTKPDTGEPFLCYSDYSGLAIKCQTKGAHSISISYTGTVAHQLSPEYIGVRDEDAATNDEYGSGIIFARYADDTKERYVLVCPEINDIVAYIDSRREPTYVSTSIPTFSGLSDMSKSSSSIKYVPWTSSSISAKGITYRMRIYNSNNSLIDVELTNSSQNSLWGLFVNPDDVFKLYAMKIALHSDYEQLIVTVSRII